jgi:hypothetical protein
MKGKWDWITRDEGSSSKGTSMRKRRRRRGEERRGEKREIQRDADSLILREIAGRWLRWQRWRVDGTGKSMVVMVEKAGNEKTRAA